MTSSTTTATLALKEWGAAIAALLDGRQTVLLRKGGIHEKAFSPDAGGHSEGRFVLFPTVAHSHVERVRPEHRDLLAVGARDAGDDRVTIRCGTWVVGVVEVARPDRLPEIADLHIWTDESVHQDRVEFRPRHPLHVLVVRAHELPEPVNLPRVDAYGGCRSWLDVPVSWDGQGRQACDDGHLAEVLARVEATVGAD